MIIRSVQLHQFRSHATAELECAPDVTILSGKNGVGKTSFLEAISVCAVGKSFVPVPDTALIQHGSDLCSVRVRSDRDLHVPYHVSVTIREGVRKKIETTFAQNCTPRDLIGELPMVALSPDHKSITMGGPAERRAFVDGLMAQSSKRVTELLYEHRRLLKQRNSMLSDAVHHGGKVAGLDSWTDAFITCSAEVIRRRKDVLDDLTPRVQEAYDAISGGEETIDVRYEAEGVEDATADVDAQLRAAYERVASREIQRGLTLFGPQKDEVAFMINNGVVRETASQGQHKSLLVSLKIAECALLFERTQERPVVLLDDVFSELDRSRCEHVMQTVLAMGMQCFVTTTEGAEMKKMVPVGKVVEVTSDK